jgi:hypothetical protein
MSAGSKPIQFLAAGHLILVLFAMCVALAGSATGTEIKTLAKNEATSLSDAQTDSLPIKIPVVDEQHIRSRRLSKALAYRRPESHPWFKTSWALSGLEHSMD